MLLKKIIHRLEKEHPEQRLEFELEQSSVPRNEPSMLEGVTRYHLILNEQPTQLYLDQSEVEALENQHGEEQALRLAVQAAGRKISELIKEQNNEVTDL